MKLVFFFSQWGNLFTERWNKFPKAIQLKKIEIIAFRLRQLVLNSTLSVLASYSNNSLKWRRKISIISYIAPSCILTKICNCGQSVLYDSGVLITTYIWVLLYVFVYTAYFSYYGHLVFDNSMPPLDSCNFRVQLNPLHLIHSLSSSISISTKV